MTKLSHTNKDGKASMVNVGDKNETIRFARAAVVVELNQATFELVKNNEIKKGDVLTVAKIAGIQAAKKTADLIPLCHPLSLTHIDIEFNLDSDIHAVRIESTVTVSGQTGVEMEALTACSVAALTIYDMVKAAQKDVLINDLKLIEKRGGKSGDFHRTDS